MRKRSIVGALVAGALSNAAVAAECKIVRDKVFPGDGEHVLLARDKTLGPDANFAVYRAPLAVNTDGAPTSYHPTDILGETMAINRFDHGISIRRTDGTRPDLAKRKAVFAEWRDHDWAVPSGFRISWQNVIAADDNGKPCVFKTGENKGYFGSLTALQNALPADQSGECQHKNQLDQRFIPAIVLRGDANPLRGYGARTGDLVVAINPADGTTVAAIIGDTGDGNRIGEGSVALNMALAGITTQPKTYNEAVKLDTGDKTMVVAVLPATRSFERVRPYTAANIKARVKSWASAKGYGGIDALAAAIKRCAGDL